jgi:hypothetical protein
MRNVDDLAIYNIEVVRYRFVSGQGGDRIENIPA